ncbi:hypothetical protein CC2G_010064 [Coprinopsis cinerea AmutBmut pab1-1]|nr:hypothetical protein CC2G_010064 [Coprinopsis cinerea AmutBmut pab1-1]
MATSWSRHIALSVLTIPSLEYTTPTGLEFEHIIRNDKRIYPVLMVPVDCRIFTTRSLLPTESWRCNESSLGGGGSGSWQGLCFSDARMQPGEWQPGRGDHEDESGGGRRFAGQERVFRKTKEAS